MRAKQYNPLQGVLFSEVAMQQMLHKPPVLRSGAPTVAVIPPLTDWQITEIAVRDCLQSAGQTDPYLLDDFMGWLGMAAVDSG